MTGRPTSPDDVTTGEQPIVFVVDDESMRRALPNLFQSVGLGVEVFDSARELLRSELPDITSCLVLDIRLPGLGGLDFQVDRQGEHSHSNRFYDRPWRYSDVGHEGWRGWSIKLPRIAKIYRAFGKIKVWGSQSNCDAGTFMSTDRASLRAHRAVSGLT